MCYTNSVLPCISLSKVRGYAINKEFKCPLVPRLVLRHREGEEEESDGHGGYVKDGQARPL